MSAAVAMPSQTRVALKPSPPGLDYKCGCCGRRLGADKYHAYVNDELKLVLTATCCDRTMQWKMWLGMGGELR
jgi:hypothetical protein